jgi:hypothetical protein
MWNRAKTTTFVRWLFLFALGIAAAAEGQQSPAPKVKVMEQLPPGTIEAKATAACTECHEARIILQQRLSKPAWTKEVDKMTKWGALVDPANRDALIDYLSSNFSPGKPPYVPPMTANEPGHSEKSAN